MSKQPQAAPRESGATAPPKEESLGLAASFAKEVTCEEAIQRNVECVKGGKSRTAECRKNFNKLSRCLEAFAP